MRTPTRRTRRSGHCSHADPRASGRGSRAEPRAREAARARLDARRWFCGFVLHAWLGFACAAPAHAQAGVGGGAEAFEVPPPPAKAPPRLAFDVHTGFSAPLRNDSLCPRGAGCVLQSGGGVGGSAERRWPSGIGVVVAYDLWFLDTDSVYELGVQQLLRAGLRYTVPTQIVFHPVFELTGGGMGYGDTFRIETVGILAQVMGGAEVELTASFGLRAGLGVRAFSHTEFRTERDNVLRGTGGPFSESFFFEVALTFQ